MHTLRLAANELIRFRTPLQRAGLAFLLCVPLLYGAIYLWSNWDPYGKLDQIPVAVVNEDQPVTVAGKRIDAGDHFVQQLKADPEFKWEFTDADDAKRGQKDGRYDMVITVPSDFSAKLASGASGTPQQAAMHIQLDDANGFLVGIMAETMQSELNRKISAAAVATYFDVAFGKLGELRSGIGQAASGAGELAAGLGTAKHGSAELAAGLRQLEAGTGKLAPGAAQVSAGVDKLTGIAVPVTERVADRLPAISAKAVAVTGTAHEFTEAVARSTARFAKFTADVVKWLKQLCKELPWICDEPGYKQALNAARDGKGDLATRLRELGASHPSAKSEPSYDKALSFAKKADATLAGAAKTLAERHPEIKRDPFYQLILEIAKEIDREAHRAARIARRINDGVSVIAADARELKRDTPKLQHELRHAAHELTRLDRGAREVATGARKLNAGASQAASGAEALDAGNAKLETGADKLASGLETAEGKIPQVKDAKKEAETLAEPVAITKSNAHPAGKYGRGLAPFFFSIALWVFGLVAFLLLRPVCGRLLASGLSAAKVAFAAWLPVLFMGACGGLLLLAVVDIFLGLNPVNLSATIGMVVLGVACFSAIEHVLRLALGAAGDALVLFLLMVQLVSSGGLYPVETLPEPFRTIHYYIPMSYLVDGLRVTISGGNSAHLWRDAGILAGFLAAALIVLVLVVRRQRTWTISRLKPDLQL